jgi:hypothetical protein
MVSIVAKTVVLDVPADWKPWLYIIKTMSTSDDERDV